MRALVVALSVLLLAGVFPVAAMTLAFRWGPTKQCFDPNSPPIRVSGVPKGTAKIRFVLHDRDAPDFHHGGGTVAYRGKDSFDYGAFRYKGPCPPTRHLYELTATALDAAGRTLATASAVRPFPPR